MDRANEKDHAVGLDYPNGVDPKPYNDIKYGNQTVPKPCNHAACNTSKDKVLSAVLEAK